LRRINRITLFSMIGLFSFVITSLTPTLTFADAVVGDTVITFGQNLSAANRQTVLTNFAQMEGHSQSGNGTNNGSSNGTNGGSNNGANGEVKTITVTNAEEYQYLGKYQSRATIGSRAISSAKIVIADPGKGVSVKSSNITAITDQMYANAAITGGVKDATIFVTAPFKVSGTAALTGIIKAFEVATGQKIDENQKQVANQEIVNTQELSKKIQDPNKAAQFMNKVKEEVAKEKPQSTQDYKNIVNNVSNQMNVNLDPQMVDRLTGFAKNFAGLNINWDSLRSQLDSIRGGVDQFVNSGQAKTFLAGLTSWISALFHKLSQFLK
jgi:uncharacterized protein YpuA (DUF1002 family)